MTIKVILTMILAAAFGYALGVNTSAHAELHRIVNELTECNQILNGGENK